MKNHAPAGSNSIPEARDRKRLAYSLLLTAGFCITEFAGGLWTNSLALLSDAGHMLSDVGGLGLSMMAVLWTLKPPTPQKTYGYHRLEILAALVNGLFLGSVALFIFYKAYGRFSHPPAVKSGPMLAIATLGLAVNILCAVLLYPSQKKSINLRAAFFHVLADGLGSLAAISAGVVMLLKGWYWFDPLASLFIGGMIILGSWHVVREASEILLESTPRHIDLAEVQCAMQEVSGVSQIHDLHIWTITSGFYALSAHAVVDDRRDRDEIGREIRKVLRERFGLEHTTIQLEGEASICHAACPVAHQGARPEI